MRNKLAAMRSLTLMAGPALGAVAFDQLDADNDNRLSREELANSGVFERWDTDGDGKLS